MKKQIIAIGGGGFSRRGVYSSDNLAIDRYFLEQTGKKKPHICFLPTASADNGQYIADFYTEFLRLSCHPSHLSFFAPHVSDIEAFLLEKDAIYVGGGNTKNMLAIWREWGVDEILRKALHQGVVLGGISAGMNCWFEECVTDSLFGELTSLKALGFLKKSCCPHYDKEEKRRPAYHKLIQTKEMVSGIAVDDHAAVHYVDGKIHAVITTQNSTAYQVCLKGGHVEETPLKSFAL